MAKQKAQPPSSLSGDDAAQVAGRLHAASIHLLRGLRKVDRGTGLSGPRLSALSVIVFGGPIAMGALAEAEQVRAPTMTRLVQGLETEGLVIRERDAGDGRVCRVRATAAGRKLLERGRRRRIASLVEGLSRLGEKDRKVLARAAGLMERLSGKRSAGRGDGARHSGRRGESHPA